jgi:hypothetical protein
MRRTGEIGKKTMMQAIENVIFIMIVFERMKKERTRLRYQK